MRFLGKRGIFFSFFLLPLEPSTRKSFVFYGNTPPFVDLSFSTTLLRSRETFFFFFGRYERNIFPRFYLQLISPLWAVLFDPELMEGEKKIHKQKVIPEEEKKKKKKTSR